MKLFVCLHNQLGAISRLRYLSESASHLLSLLVSESIFQLPLPTFGIYLYVCLFMMGLLYLGGPGSGMLPRERPFPARYLLHPGCVGQEAAEGHLPPPLTPTSRRVKVPGWQRWAWRDTAEMPFSLNVLPASSPRVSRNHLCKEGLGREVWRGTGWGVA